MVRGLAAAVPANELVLEQLRRAIHLGRFAPGEKLPPEREVAQQLGASRTVVRDAARVLEDEGLIEVRRGPAGGIVVLARRGQPSELQTQLREFEDLLDYRTAVESMAARLAADRRTQNDLFALRRAFNRLEAIVQDAGAEVSAWLGADSEYHVLIARTTRNELITETVEEIRAGMFRPIGSLWGRIASDAHAMHAELQDAIADGDGERASSAMAVHIGLTRMTVRDALGAPDLAVGPRS